MTSNRPYTKSVHVIASAGDSFADVGLSLTIDRPSASPIPTMSKDHVEQFKKAADMFCGHLTRIHGVQESLAALQDRLKTSLNPKLLSSLRQETKGHLENGVRHSADAAALMRELLHLQQQTLQGDQTASKAGLSYEMMTATAIGSYHIWLQQLSDAFLARRDALEAFEMALARRKIALATGRITISDRQLQELLTLDEDKFRCNSLYGAAVAEERGSHVVVQILDEAREGFATHLQLQALLVQLHEAVADMAGAAAQQCERVKRIQQAALRSYMIDLGEPATPSKPSKPLLRAEGKVRPERSSRSWLRRAFQSLVAPACCFVPSSLPYEPLYEECEASEASTE